METMWNDQSTGTLREEYSREEISPHHISRKAEKNGSMFISKKYIRGIRSTSCTYSDAKSIERRKNGKRTLSFLEA